jgi:seryl-tRNA synthetase
VELAKAQNQGGLSEADAVKAALARKQIADTMQEVKDLFTVSGNGALYQQCIQEMANARKAKQQELAMAAAKKKQMMKEIRNVALILIACATFLPLIIWGIVSLLLNR